MNDGCSNQILFKGGPFGIPVKTYCDNCCGEMSSPPNFDDGACAQCGKLGVFYLDNGQSLCTACRHARVLTGGDEQCD